MSWVALLSAQPVRQASTLQMLLQQGVTAFEAGDYAQADALFDELEAVFGQEAAYQAASLQRVVLPLRGYAAWVAGFPEEAVTHFTAFLTAFPEDDRKGPFVRFALAQSHQANGAPAAARDAFFAFMARYPDRPEMAMAQMRAAELAVELNAIDAALTEFTALAQGRAPFSVRQEARLRALQVALDFDRYETAAVLLHEGRWAVEVMPELAVLTFAALQLADWHAGREEWLAALNAYRLVLPRDHLLALQRTRQAELEARLQRQASFRDGEVAGIWGAYYRGISQRVTAFLAELETMDDYTAPALLRYGVAYLQAGRPWEAAAVLRSVAEDLGFPSAIRAEAHYRWIITAQVREDWAEALALARQLVDRYPEARQAPLALYLIGNALQNLEQYPEAIAVFRDLITRYPEHPFFPRFLFARGFAHLLHEDYPAAREDFAAYTNRYPDRPLATNARFWHAQAWFLEKAYAPALAEFDTLLVTTPADHYLLPEMRYRRGAVLYAQRDYAAARVQLETYLQEHPEHPSRAEARVLLGDTYMGLGELQRASVIFNQVGPEAKGLFPYAVFQRGKIFRALERYDLMADHYTAYAQRTDLTWHPRVSEALYWVGWARKKQGRIGEVFSLFREALDRFGNDLTATEMQAILASLHDLHRRYPKDPAALAEAERDPLLEMDDFLEWVTLEMQTARAAEQYTYYGRLATYQYNQRIQSIARLSSTDPAEANAWRARWEEAVRGDGAWLPQAAMDAETLAMMGAATAAEDRARARAYWHDLLARFPTSPARAKAWQGLMPLAEAEKDAEGVVHWAGQFIEAFPQHADYPGVVIEWATHLHTLERGSEAVARLEEILRLRHARGRHHAEAMYTLARIAEAHDQPERAIAYYQNVYNLYRAHPDLVTSAYQQSAQLFEARGDLGAAYRTYREMTFQDTLLDTATRTQAAAEMTRLESSVPIEQRTHAETLAAEVESHMPKEGGAE